jgi:hypothetical protein
MIVELLLACSGGILGGFLFSLVSWESKKLWCERNTEKFTKMLDDANERLSEMCKKLD